MHVSLLLRAAGLCEWVHAWCACVRDMKQCQAYPFQECYSFLDTIPLQGLARRLGIMEPMAAAQEAQWAQVAPPASFLHAAAAEMARRVTQYANNQVRLTRTHNSSTYRATQCCGPR